MGRTNWELWGIIIAIIEFDINYYVYSKTGVALNVVIIIVASLIIAPSFIISHIYSNINEISNNQDELNKGLIREKELEDIRLDLREIKKEILKKK